MGCALGKSHRYSPKATRHDDRDDITSGAHQQRARQSRVRRLSQTVFEAEMPNLNGDDVTTIPVPIPMIHGESDINIPIKTRRQRRASFLQIDNDPREKIARVAFSCVAGAESGITKRNQDAALLSMDPNSCVFGVFDGHGAAGHHCSNFLRTIFPSMLKVNLLDDFSTADTLARAILDAEKSMLQANFDCSLSGSTATIVMVQSSRLLVAWVGDSPCFVVSVFQNLNEAKFSCRNMSPAHNFDRPGERERILSAGGRVMRWTDDGEWYGPFRVFLPERLVPGLNMSRSLADVLVHRVGVSSEPEVTSMEWQRSDKFIVLGSDGLTEFLTMDEIAQILIAHSDIQEACDSIVTEARRRWMVQENCTADDITIIVIELRLSETFLEITS